jgi:hypothetical protein
LDAPIDFELYTDLAFAHEAIGDADQGNQHRELALQLAERQGNFGWAAIAVLTPPANGRALASGRTISQISRAINLAGPDACQQTILHLRAERVHRLAISGAAGRLPEEDLPLLQSIQSKDVTPDTWIQITRARLCSDLATANLDQRTAATTTLLPARTHCEDLDLRADSLVLAVRNALEIHHVETVDFVLQQVEEEFLTSPRPMDRWIRNVLRCTALAVRGQLSAAYSHAVEAQRLGVLYGISDSALTWQLQSAQLLTRNADLPALVGVEPAVDIPVFNPTIEDETMEGNLLALGLGFLAHGEVELGNHDAAASHVSMAQQFFNPIAHDFHLVAAAAQIVQTCLALNLNPAANVVEPLRSAGTSSIILGMISGWSMGPASRYAALANHLNGNSKAALSELLQCADHCRETKQQLWEFAALEDVLRIDLLTTSLSADQHALVAERARRVRDRFM